MMAPMPGFILPPRVFHRAPRLLMEIQNKAVTEKPSRVGGSKGNCQPGGNGRGCIPAGRRFRGYNIRTYENPAPRRGRPRQTHRGQFLFKAFNTDWSEIKNGEGNQLMVTAENSNAGAKKVISALKQLGTIQIGEADAYDFYMTSGARLDPSKAFNVAPRTRFYHYEGRFIAKPTEVTKQRGRKRYEVEGIAEVSAVDGERFAVPFSNMEKVQEAVTKILSGQVSIRSIQRQSMLDNKERADRRRFIEQRLGNLPRDQDYRGRFGRRRLRPRRDR